MFQIDKLLEASVVMLMGMGTVFLFLVVMVFAMNIMSKAVFLLNKICPEMVEVKTKSVSSSSNNNEDEIALSIALSVLK